MRPFRFLMGELALVELCVEALLLQKLFMPSLLDDVPVLHNQNPVGSLDSR